jgi:zinc/manganese transport system substrate-binding protein
MVKGGSLPAPGLRRVGWGSLLGAAVAAIVLVQAVPIFFAGALAQTVAPCTDSKRLKIVAAENFYQDIAGQIGGRCAEVKSLLSDPNVDPHEYEPTVKDARAVAGADLVIENGGGYDDWMNKLLSSSPNSGRLVINVWDISPVKLPENEHVWYSLEDVKAMAGAMAADLRKLRPAQAAEFDRNLKTFTSSLDRIGAKIGRISKRFSGTPIALTEPIFLYQTNPMGLTVLTPFEFQKAVAEGIDPPADTMLTAQEQVRKKLVRVLVINRQTADRFTQKLEKLAKASGVPVVAVTETMPPGKNYQAWMLDQLTALESALGGSKTGAGSDAR